MFPFPETPSMTSRSLDDDKHYKHAKATLIKSETMDDAKEQGGHKWKCKKSSSSNSSISIAPASSSSNRESLLTNLLRLVFQNKVAKAKSEKQKLRVLQKVLNYYTLVLDYRISRLAIHFLR